MFPPKGKYQVKLWEAVKILLDPMRSALPQKIHVMVDPVWGQNQIFEYMYLSTWGMGRGREWYVRCLTPNPGNFHLPFEYDDEDSAKGEPRNMQEELFRRLLSDRCQVVFEHTIEHDRHNPFNSSAGTILNADALVEWIDRTWPSIAEHAEEEEIEA